MGRFDYVKYDEEAQALQSTMKMRCEELENAINLLPDSREKSLAITKLEEVYARCGRAIRDHQIARNGSAELQEARSPICSWFRYSC